MHVINVLSYSRCLSLRNVIIGKIITVAHYLDHCKLFCIDFRQRNTKRRRDANARVTRARSNFRAKARKKNWRKLVSIRGTVSLINSVRRGASRITATAAKAVGFRSPAKSGLNLIYTTHFLAPGGSAYLRSEAHEGAIYTDRRRDGEFPHVYVSSINPTRSGDVKEKRRRRL